MHRRHALVGLAVLALPADAFAQADASPEAVIRTLYQVHLAAVQQDRPRPSVISSPALRRRFLTPALAAAIARELRSPEGLGADPIIATNGDPEVRNLRVRQVSADQERATVVVTWTRWENQRVELRYALMRVNGAWLVHDIVLPPGGPEQSWSLRQLLNMRN